MDRVHDLRFTRNAGYGESPAHALGRGHDVGLDPGVLDGEHLPRPAETGLDLVNDHHDAVLVTQFSQFLI